MKMISIINLDLRVWTGGPVKLFMILRVSRVRVIIIKVRIISIMIKDGIMMTMMNIIQINTILEEDTDSHITEIMQETEIVLFQCQVTRGLFTKYKTLQFVLPLQAQE